MSSKPSAIIVELRRLQAQRLGQQAEHHGRDQRPHSVRRAADQRDQHGLEADEGVERWPGRCTVQRTLIAAPTAPAKAAVARSRRS